MPTIPEYQVQTDSIMNYNTRETGPHAQASDFNPFDAEAASKLTEGFNSLTNTLDQRQQKEDMVWAQSQFASAQVKWAQDIPKYTDPDKLTTDLQSYTENIMKGAPNGQASDMLVQHMNSLAPRLVRRTMVNQAKASVNAVSAQYVSSANSLAALATGSGLPDTSAAPNTDGSPPADPAPITPMLSSQGLREAYNQTDQTKAAATGTVPSAVINQTDNTVKMQIAKGIIKAASIEDGPGEIANQLEKDPTSVIPADAVPRIQNQLPGIINGYRLQHSADVGVAKLNAQQALIKDVQATDAGNYPGDAAVLAHAQAVGSVEAGKKGARADEATLSYLTQVNGAQEAFNFKSGILGQPPDVMQDKLNEFNESHDDNPHALAMANASYNKLLITFKESPADYPMESPAYRDSYTSASDQLNKFPTDPGVISHFQNVLRGGIAIQNGFRGITPDSSSQDVAKASSLAGVIPKVRAQALVSAIQNGTTEQATAALHSVQDQYGPLASNAMHDLMKQGLDAKYMAVASFRDNPLEATLTNAIALDSPAKGQLSANAILKLEDANGNSTPKLTELNDAVHTAFTPYSQAVSWNNDGARQGGQIENTVSSLAKSYMIQRGMEAPAAADQAYKDIISNQMDMGSVNGRGFIVTKAFVPDGDTGSVIDGAKSLIPQIAQGNAYAPDMGAVYGKPAASLTQDEKDDYRQALTKYGSWVNTPDGKGLRLAVDAQKIQMLYPAMTNLNNRAGTGMAFPTNEQGKPIEIPLTAFQFNKWGKQ
jgi:hypothetical protein